jgi:AraC-like DNA-binding protein
MKLKELAAIRNLVGEVTAEQLRYVDCFVGGGLGLFIPTVGPCFYAVTPDHSHPAYSFALAFDACTRVVAGGETFPSQPGRIMAFDPGAIHHEAVADEPPHYIVIFVERPLFEVELARYPVLTPTPFNFRTFSPGRELTGLLKEFMNEAEARLPGRDPLLTAIGIRIVHSLIRAAFTIASPPDRIGSRIEIHRTIQHIQTHSGEKLTVESLAAIAGISPSHFSRVFRRETGRTPLTFLNRVRLDQARKLLRAGERSISTVALTCGFATPSHFCAAFRRAFGQSPSEFVKSLI